MKEKILLIPLVIRKSIRLITELILLQLQIGAAILNKQIDYQSQWLPLPELAAGMYRVIIRSGEWSYKGSLIRQP